MKNKYIFMLAAFCTVTTILSCEKFLPDVSGTDHGDVTTVKKDIPVFYNSFLALKDRSFFISSTNQIKKVSARGSASVFAGIPVTDNFGRPAEGPADSVDLHTPSGFTLYNKVLYMAVHPEYFGDP